jgi:hypothetical protein
MPCGSFRRSNRSTMSRSGRQKHSLLGEGCLVKCLVLATSWWTFAWRLALALRGSAEGRAVPLHGEGEVRRGEVTIFGWSAVADAIHGSTRGGGAPYWIMTDCDGGALKVLKHGHQREEKECEMDFMIVGGKHRSR